MLQLSVSQKSSREQVSLLIQVTEGITELCPALIGSNKIREINVINDNMLNVRWLEEPNEMEETAFNAVWESLGKKYDDVQHAIIMYEY